MRIPPDHIRVAKVIGESDEGVTLFVPKDETGVFHLSEGDQFVTIMFCRAGEEPGTLEVWLPWGAEPA